jgi:hypothetical protein
LDPDVPHDDDASSLERRKLFLESIDLSYSFEVAQETESKEQVKEDLEVGVEFRLFSKPSHAKDNTTGATTRIRLSSPGAIEGEPGLLLHRPQSYYFTGQLSREEKARLSTAAISGDQVIQFSKRTWPGLHRPWRIIKVDGVSRVGSLLDQLNKAKHGRRTRLGKKGRVAVRMRAEKQKIASEAAKQAEADKELHDRMKKSKKNRDKKLRQREKEKVKKATARAGAEQAP